MVRGNSLRCDGVIGIKVLGVMNDDFNIWYPQTTRMHLDTSENHVVIRNLISIQ